MRSHEEEGREARVKERSAGGGEYARRLLGALIAGGLLAAVAAAATGFGLLAAQRFSGSSHAAALYRAFLAAGGWLGIPLWGAALAALRAVGWASRARERWAAFGLAIVLVVLPLVLRPAVVDLPRRPAQSVRAKARAILRWSYDSPHTVAQILPLSRDPDPLVREQAILALGVNLIVTDIEHATVTRPARYAQHPLRDSLRTRLLEALCCDRLESVRAEAARALWKAPFVFGRQPAAAETLAAVLGRATLPGAVERLTWLALDAAAGAPDPSLKRAAARFAAATPDTELRRVARAAAEIH